MGSCATLKRSETPIPIHPVTHPMQDPKSNLLFACQFNKSVKVVRSKTDNLTSDAGVIPMRLLMVISTLPADSLPCLRTIGPKLGLRIALRS